jgi:WD40 repeat protein
VQTLSLNPSGTILASGGIDTSVRLWHPDEERPFLTLTEHTASVVHVAFNRDGTTLASCASDKTIRFWSVRKGENLTTLQGYQKVIEALALSPDGNYMAATGNNYRVAVWYMGGSVPVSDQPILPVARLKGHNNLLSVISFSRDGSRLASSGHEAVVNLWDLTGEGENRQGHLRYSLGGHNSVVHALDFSPDGRILASGDGDGKLRLWSTITGELIASLEGHKGIIWSIAFSPDDTTIASAGNDGLIHLWDAKTYRPTAQLGPSDAPLVHLTYSPDGSLIGCGDRAGKIYIWSTANLAGEPIVLEGHVGACQPYAFRTDPQGGIQLLSCGNDGTARLWDVAQKEVLSTITHGNFVLATAFMSEGKQVVTAGDTEFIKVWKHASGDLQRVYRDYLPYEGVNIYGARGLTPARRATLLELGAVEYAQLSINLKKNFRVKK